MTLQELVADDDTSNPPADLRQTDVDLACDVYARYVRVEGVSYVRSLSNVPPSEAQDSAVRVLKARPGGVVRTVHVRYDHLGVRGVWFTLPDDDMLRCLDTSGGLKIRRLLDSTTPESKISATPTGWPRPGLICTVMNDESFDVSDETFDHLGVRMNSFAFNEPGVDGYSFALDAWSFSILHAHPSGANNTPFYKEVDSLVSDLLWIYMPVDQGEYIQELWSLWSGENAQSLMFLTNLGREVLFGHHLREAAVLIHRLFATTGEPSRIYVNEWGRGSVNRFIEFIGVESDAESEFWVREDDRTEYPRSLIRDPPPAGTLLGEALCYTHCRMEDVAEITLCVDRTSELKPVIGLLLRYNSGRRSCLGRYRLDWTLGPVRVDTAHMLRIGMGETKDGLPYVAEVSVGGVSGPESLTWLEVPWHGRLVWWFAHSHCRLEYVE